MIIAATGHRPASLGGYSIGAKLDLFANTVLCEYTPEFVISGGALGWDQAIAKASIALNIPLVLAIPCNGYSDKWPWQSQEVLDNLINKACHVELVSPGPYATWKLFQRNQWMVDQLVSRDDVLLALYNGSSGGTSSCLDYASRANVHINHVWPAWYEYKK